MCVRYSFERLHTLELMFTVSTGILLPMHGATFTSLNPSSRGFCALCSSVILSELAFRNNTIWHTIQCGIQYSVAYNTVWHTIQCGIMTECEVCTRQHLLNTKFLGESIGTRSSLKACAAHSECKQPVLTSSDWSDSKSARQTPGLKGNFGVWTNFLHRSQDSTHKIVLFKSKFEQCEDVEGWEGLIPEVQRQGTYSGWAGRFSVTTKFHRKSSTVKR